MRVFVSMSHEDRRWVEDRLIDLLRRHFVDTWYWRDVSGAGRLSAQIEEGLDASDYFLVVLSPSAVKSSAVIEEIEWAMSRPKLAERIIPIRLDKHDRSKLPVEFVRRNYRYLSARANYRRFESELLHCLGVEQHPMDEWQAGTVKLPLFVLVGGDAHVKYQWPDGIEITETTNDFGGHPEIEPFKNKRIAEALAEAATNGTIIENRPMTRLEGYSWGLRSPDDAEWPLRLVVGRTDYYTQLSTNAAAQERLAGGRTVLETFGGSPEEFPKSLLANPLCTNLSIVTADHVIYVAKRGHKVAMNKGGFAPAVSGTGNPERDLQNGKYTPFETARAEAAEEAFRPVVPELSMITFFGLARTAKFRYPFLFGELRTPLTSRELDSLASSWENRGRIGIPFTIDAVTAWVKETYSNYVANRGRPGDTTAIFSLLQSLKYEYPDRWVDIVHLLTFDPRSESDDATAPT